MFIPVLPISAQVPATLDEAASALRAGDYPRAEAGFRALLAAHPNSPEILDNLAITFQLEGKSNDAIRTFQRVLKLKRLPDAVALLALEYCRNHEFNRAAPLLNEAKSHFDDPNIMVKLGPCYLEAGRPEDAVVVYQKLVNAKFPPEDENAVNLVRAYFDLSRKLLESLATLPGGAIYARVVQAAKRDGSLDARSLFPRAYDEASYLKQNMPIEEAIAQLPAHQNDPALLYVLGVESAEHAAAGFDRVQDAWPDSLALGQLTAELKDFQGDRSGAIQTYEDLLAKHPDAPPSVHFSLGLMYAERRRWQDALEQYRSVNLESKGSLYLKQRISEALLHLDQNQAVVELLSKIVATPGAPFWALRDFGEASEGLGQAETAKSYLKRASAMDPGDASIHYHLLRVYHKLNDTKAAEAELSTFKQLSERSSTSIGALQKPHLELAAKFDRSHQIAKAEAEWRAVLAIDPESSLALNGLSSDLIIEKNYSETIALLEDSRLIGQRTQVQIVNLGLAYCGMGRLDDSAKVLRDGLNTSPDSLPLANTLAKVLTQLAKPREAETVLELALARHPGDLSTELLYLRVLLETNREKAAAIGKAMILHYPTNWEVQYLVGVLDAKDGRPQKAREHLERSVSLNASSAESRAALGLLLAQLNDMAGAKEQLQKAIALGAGSQEVKMTLSNVLASLGEAKGNR
jgi:tetratricopeptide (TPR) repeat protein